MLREQRIKNLEICLLQAVEASWLSYQGRNHPDTMLIMQEAVHYLLNHQVVYISTPLAQSLMNTEIELELDNLYIPFRLFEICFENDFKIYKDYVAPGTLVLAKADDAILSAFNNFATLSTNFITKNLNEYQKLRGLPPIKPDQPDISDDLQKMLSLRFQSPVDQSLCHCVINSSIDAGKSVDAIIDGLKMFDNSGIFELNQDEREIEKRLMRIVLGSMCYLGTQDPDVIEYRNRNRKSFYNKPKEILLGGKFEKDTSWHLRKAHWRFLKDKRFERDKDGNVKCVWVKSAEVNKYSPPAIPDEKVTKIGD